MIYDKDLNCQNWSLSYPELFCDNGKSQWKYQLIFVSLKSNHSEDYLMHIKAHVHYLSKLSTLNFADFVLISCIDTFLVVYNCVA